MQLVSDEKKLKPTKINLHKRFLRHTGILIWKCYLQRRRRWGLLLVESAFAMLLFLGSIFTAKPVFLTPIQAKPKAPLETADVLDSLDEDSLVGYAPNISPYTTVMDKAAHLLHIDKMLSAQTEDDLNEMLYNRSRGVPLKVPIIWVIWKSKDKNIWSLNIRSTERARYISRRGPSSLGHYANHFQAGFLAVQLAISQAIIEISSKTPPDYEVTLCAMPVSPLMEENKVRQVLSGLLLYFTLALLPPVLEAQALVVIETSNKFKRALRLRNVEYHSIYIGWVVYGYLSCLPICILASITLILIFRWIHLVEALVIVLAYVTVMIIIAYIMAMFHSKALIAGIWTILFTLLQSYISELLVYHGYDRMAALTFFWHLILPPMGLLHAFFKFALLQTQHPDAEADTSSLAYIVLSWSLMNMLCFGVLMVLQRTIGYKSGIGAQKSWKSVIFKKAAVQFLTNKPPPPCSEDPNKLRKIIGPTKSDFERLQEVDEFVAKAISFRNVSKSIMGVPVLDNITFDIYRCEFNILYSERMQDTMINTIDDLLTGLTPADQGSVIVLGEKIYPGSGVMTTPQMMGYCHHSDTLIEDLTVQEHFTLFSTICLWNRRTGDKNEYAYIRSKRLVKQCDLESVRYEQVRNLNIYYKAQLCWAIAMFLEPKIIVVPEITEYGVYKDVIEDKIMEYKKYKTIVLYSFLSSSLQYADRVFVFDSKVLIFGGTPAYMFFKHGREYRLRLFIRRTETFKNQKKLLDRLGLASARIGAHFAYLIILRLPVNPSSSVAELVKDLTENSKTYGLKSLNISVPDTEEVCSSVIADYRDYENVYKNVSDDRSKQALERLDEPLKWTRRSRLYDMHMKRIISKFILFHMNYKVGLAVTFLSAVIAGVFLGISMPAALLNMNPDGIITNGEFQRLTVEDMKIKTTLVLRSDNSTAGRSIAHGYVLSDTNAKPKEIENMDYTAVPYTEDLTEYLVLRAIDSPQEYVYQYAYGMDVFTDENGTVKVSALYSPIHRDSSAQARSLARVYMALLRHYTGSMEATIKIDDDPLTLDLSVWMIDALEPNRPLFLQLLLIISIWHITFIPSMEYGLIRHLQKHATNFSPLRYWFTLYFCDFLLYWLLIAIMAVIMISIILSNLATSQFMVLDLLIVPIMLTVYGIGCVPQAYIFSLTPWMGINAMIFIIFNLVFSETTIITEIFYGNALSYILNFMTLSPQFNIAYAYIKIKEIFLYNNECYIYNERHLCSKNTYHKCCEKCGVLQECFSKKGYFNEDPGVLLEFAAMFTTAIFFMILLLLIEYRIFHRIWSATAHKVAIGDSGTTSTKLSSGCLREKRNVLNKNAELNNTRRQKNRKLYDDNVDQTVGEYLLATGVTKRYKDVYMLHEVYFGIGKGQVLSVLGHKRHGRIMLCEILAGYKMPSNGDVWSMSKNKLKSQPHKYSQQVSYSCDQKLLPSWMKISEALSLIAALRGVPHKHIHEVVTNHIEALELNCKKDFIISDLPFVDRMCLNFAAAVIGAPPVIVLDSCTAFQKFSVRRAMYSIVSSLKKRGHAIIICSGSIKGHMPLSDRLAIMLDGTFHDVDTEDRLLERYGEEGFTIVVHLKNEVDINSLFGQYFTCFVVNDTTEVLVNVQVKDAGLTWTVLFEKMEALKAENQEVYSYIVTAMPIDYIYNSIINKGPGFPPAQNTFSWNWWKKLMLIKPKIMPKPKALSKLVPLEEKYGITKLKELPWSVIFHR